MDNISEFVGNKIKAFRKEKKLTQTELGKKLNKSSSTISDYEKAITEPTQDTLFKLAEIFNVSINDFFPTNPSIDYPDAKLSNEDAKFLDDLKKYLADLEEAKRKNLLLNIELAVELFKKQK